MKLKLFILPLENDDVSHFQYEQIESANNGN